MKTIRISRKRQFRSALMPYWIIIGISKEQFMQEHGLEGDLVSHSEIGQGIPRINISVLDEIGIRIQNGETLTLEVQEETFLFASTIDGSLSNEILLSSLKEQNYQIITLGGWTGVSYPHIETKE